MAGNKSFTKAKQAKEDEFYTQLSDIEKELKHYREHFFNKIILCNCDDPEYSNFWKYFSLNFDFFRLKKLIATHYDEENKSYKLEMYRDDMGVHTEIKSLKEDGDFRSSECIELLKQADIVVTNPPFSLFREYVQQLINYEKKFVIIGSQNNITYKETFKLLKNDQMWIGYQSGNMSFQVPEYYEPRKTRFWVDESGQKWRSLGNICWYTNLDIKKRHEELVLYKHYNPEEYPKYDNYDAISVNKVKEIPCDYYGAMGVPITFMDKYNPEQFEFLGIDRDFTNDNGRFKITENGMQKTLYARLVIKRRVKNEN